jgi:hypothetical protein
MQVCVGGLYGTRYAGWSRLAPTVKAGFEARAPLKDGLWRRAVVPAGSAGCQGIQGHTARRLTSLPVTPDRCQQATTACRVDCQQGGMHAESTTPRLGATLVFLPAKKDAADTHMAALKQWALQRCGCAVKTHETCGA